MAEGRDGANRRGYLQPLGTLVPALTRPAFRKRAPAAAQVLADWPSIVGPALAAVTVPRRLIAGTLTLACTGPVALELQHLAGLIAERINGYLGRIVVERLRFVQEAPTHAPAPARPARQGKPVEVPGLPPGDLRDALSRLGGAVARKEG